jgi:cytochrome c oxidase subunit III
MPTIFTPPQVDPRHRPDRSGEPGDGDHGSGRRPPIDKRTGGNDNGDGDDWKDRPVGSRGPRERIDQYRVALGFSLSAILMFFIGLVTAFIVTKSNYHYDPHFQYINSWRPTPVPHIVWFSTAALLLSSIAAESARRSMFRENDAMDEWIGLGRPISRRASLWLSVTLALGTVFFAGQADAWQQLAARPAYLRSGTSSKFFYIFTVIHAVHLLLGLGALVAALVGLRNSRRLTTRQVLVDTTVWYWHAMGALWLCLFILLEFFQ